MPLNEDDWEQLTPVVSYRETILDFFKQNPSTAYSVDDIMSEHTSLTEDDGLAYTVILTYYRSLLDYLSAQGEVDERQLERESENGVTEYISYYRFKQSDEE